MVRGSALAEFRRRATPPIPPTTATPTSTPFPAPGDQAALLAAADRVLQWQADPSRASFTEQGDFVEQLRNVGLLDDGRFRRYLSTGVNFMFKVRDEYRIGDPFPTQIDTTWRLGSFGGPVGRWRVALRARAFDGEFVKASSSSGNIFAPLASGNGRLEFTANRDREVFSRLPVGPVDLEVEFTTDIFESNTIKEFPNQRDKPFMTLKNSRLVPIQLLPPDRDNILRIQPAGLAEELRAAMGAPRLRIRQTPSGLMIDLNMNLSAVPTDLAMASYIVHNGTEIRIGSILAEPSTRARSWIGTDPIKDPWTGRWPERVSVILRPNDDIARRSVNIKQVADVELRWDDIPTSAPTAPPARPATGPAIRK